jgi:hypothetical protein
MVGNITWGTVRGGRCLRRFPADEAIGEELLFGVADDDAAADELETDGDEAIDVDVEVEEDVKVDADAPPPLPCSSSRERRMASLRLILMP